MSILDVSDTVVPTTTPSCSDLADSVNLMCLTSVPAFVVAVTGAGVLVAGTGVAVADAAGVSMGVPKRRRCDFFRKGVAPSIIECILTIIT